MEKLKTRMDAFSDAVIAIIITIMVLELPLPAHNSITEYLQFGKAIGIFFISFCFIANIWYQHSVLFNDAKTMNNKIFILEFVFLAFLALIPTFTKLLTYDTNRYTVMAYGILTIIVNGILMFLTYSVVQLKYHTSHEIGKIFTKIYLNQSNSIGLISFAVLVLGYFQPTWAVVFYIALPVVSFFFNRDDRSELRDIAVLSTTDQDRYLQLSSDKLREFRIKQRQIGHKYARQRQSNPSWREDMAKEMSQLFENSGIDPRPMRNVYPNKSLQDRK